MELKDVINNRDLRKLPASEAQILFVEVLKYCKDTKIYQGIASNVKEGTYISTNSGGYFYFPYIPVSVIKNAIKEAKKQ